MHVKLDLKPDALHVDSDVATLVQHAFDKIDPAAPRFSVILDTVEPVQAFVAHTPDVALKWICRRVARKRLIQYVNHIYDNPGDEDQGLTDDTNNEHVARTRRPTKRARLRENQIVQRQGSPAQPDVPTEDDADDPHQLTTVVDNVALPAALPAADVRYHDFAKRIGGCGAKELTSMINRASAVGAFECLEDWRIVLETWREAHRNGRRMFTNNTPLPTLDERPKTSSCDEDGSSDGGPGTVVLSQRTEHSNVPSALTRQEVVGFRNLLATVRRSQAADILSDVRHRWCMTALYMEYERLEKLLRSRVKLTGRRGRGIATVARERLFQEIDSQGRASDSQGVNPANHKLWNRYLEYGKRWLLLKERFGIGVFALMPRGLGINSFVERTPIKRVQDWMNMLATCNPNVRDMSDAIEPLLVSCMMEESPPGVLLLETVEATEFDEWDAIDLLLPASDTQRDFEIVLDTVQVEDSQPFR